MFQKKKWMIELIMIIDDHSFQGKLLPFTFMSIIFVDLEKSVSTMHMKILVYFTNET